MPQLKRNNKYVYAHSDLLREYLTTLFLHHGYLCTHTLQALKLLANHNKLTVYVFIHICSDLFKVNQFKCIYVYIFESRAIKSLFQKLTWNKNSTKLTTFMRTSLGGFILVW